MKVLTKSELKVFFDDPFWVGILERLEGGKLSVCKITFGAEPTDAQIYAFILSRYNKLKFSRPQKTAQKQKADSPKRRIRDAKKLLKKGDIGTKSQQVLKKQYEEMKIERKTSDKERREAEKQRQFDLRQQKRKEKHKGH